jgi:hypothetical protein
MFVCLVVEREIDSDIKSLFMFYGHVVKEKIEDYKQITIRIINKWFGFIQEKFTKKGKYYSANWFTCLDRPFVLYIILLIGVFLDKIATPMSFCLIS